MKRTLITMTNGASAEDISDAIGKFLEQQNEQIISKKLPSEHIVYSEEILKTSATEDSIDKSDVKKSDHSPL